MENAGAGGVLPASAVSGVTVCGVYGLFRRLGSGMRAGSENPELDIDHALVDLEESRVRAAGGAVEDGAHDKEGVEAAEGGTEGEARSEALQGAASGDGIGREEVAGAERGPRVLEHERGLARAVAVVAREPLVDALGEVEVQVGVAERTDAAGGLLALAVAVVGEADAGPVEEAHLVVGVAAGVADPRVHEDHLVRGVEAGLG